MSRRTLTRIVFAVGVSAALVGDVRVSGEQQAPTEPRRERDICTQAAEWAAAHPISRRLFGGASRESSRRLTWRDYGSQADLDKVAGGTVFDFASVWTLPSGGLFVQTEATSFSGDWALYVDYCFRPSGSVVQINSELRVLPGQTMTKEAFEFGANGEQAAVRTTYYDLKTKAALVGEAVDTAREWKTRFPTPMYKRTLDLPFHHGLDPIS